MGQLEASGDVSKDFMAVWPKLHTYLQELGLDCSESAAGMAFSAGYGAALAYWCPQALDIEWKEAAMGLKSSTAGEVSYGS